MQFSVLFLVFDNLHDTPWFLVQQGAQSVTGCPEVLIPGNSPLNFTGGVVWPSLEHLVLTTQYRTLFDPNEKTMSIWLWDSSLSVGIDAVDGQHRRIIDYINELEVAKLDDDKEIVSEVLMGLVDYTRTHFLFEEDLMRQAGYPLSDAHKKTHDAFVAHVIKYVRQYENGQDVTRKLSSDLRVWLTNHIKRDDKDYAPYVANTNRGWAKKMLGSVLGQSEFLIR